jgi:hypothetical protein
MADETVLLPPLSEVARLDGEISGRIHRLFSGVGTGDDMGQVAALIRERANATLPPALLRRRAERGLSD